MYRFILVVLVLATPANAGPAAHTSAAPIPVILPHTPPPASKPVIAPVLPVTPTVVPTLLPAKPAVLPVAPAKPAIPNTVIPHTGKTTQVTGLPLTIVQPTKVQMHVLSDPSYAGTVTGTYTGIVIGPFTAPITTNVTGKTATEVVTFANNPPVTVTETLKGNTFTGTGTYQPAPGEGSLTVNLSGTITGGTITGTLSAYTVGGGPNRWTGTFSETR